MDSLISASKSAMQKPIATVNKDSSTVTSMPCRNSSAYGAINEKLLNLIKPSILIPFSFSVSFLSQSVFVYPAKKACPCSNLHPDKIPVLKIVCHKKLPHSVCFASCSSFSAVFICFSAIFHTLPEHFFLTLLQPLSHLPQLLHFHPEVLRTSRRKPVHLLLQYTPPENHLPLQLQLLH